MPTPNHGRSCSYPIQGISAMLMARPRRAARYVPRLPTLDLSGWKRVTWKMMVASPAKDSESPIVSGPRSRPVGGGADAKIG